MMIKLVLLLFAALPLMARADNPIQVDFWTSQDDQIMMNAQGVDRTLVTGGDFDAFRIKEEHLKRSFRELSGAEPDHIYFRDPTTDFGDLFAINNWPQSSTILGVADFELVDYREETFTMTNNNLTNFSDQAIEVGGDVPYIVRDSIFNRWPIRLIQRETGHQIRYNFNLKDGKDKFYVVNDWGRDALHSHEKKLVTSFNQTLEPQQTINIRHTLLEAIGHAKVTYLVGMVGNAVGHFPRGHNGRNFWPFSLNSLLQAIQVAPTFTITQTIDFNIAIAFNIEYQFQNSRREVCPGLMVDLADEVIVDPTDEDFQRVREITRVKE